MQRNQVARAGSDVTAWGASAADLAVHLVGGHLAQEPGVRDLVVAVHDMVPNTHRAFPLA